MRIPRWVMLTIVAISMLALIGTGYVSYNAAHRRPPTHWAQVRRGMSAVEVESLLGKPDTIYRIGSGLVPWDTDSLYERWAYGHRRVFKTRDTFPYVGMALDGLFSPEAEDCVVFFSREGTVTILQSGKGR